MGSEPNPQRRQECGPCPVYTLHLQGKRLKVRSQQGHPFMWGRGHGSCKMGDNTLIAELSFQVIDGIMGIKKSEGQLPTVDHRLLQHEGGA